MEPSEDMIAVYAYMERIAGADGIASPTLAKMEADGYGRREIVRGIVGLCRIGALTVCPEIPGYRVNGTKMLFSEWDW